jgi:hypothetical protein
MFRKLSLVAATLLAMAPAAKADVLSISAMSFNLYDPSGNPRITATNGTLSPALASDLFAGVTFPKSGLVMCSFALVYQDSNGAENVKATLYRKRFLQGSDAEGAATPLAAVTSSGALGTMQRAKTTSVVGRTVDMVNYFYFVKISAQNFNTIPVGVQIEVKTACP